MKPKLTLAAIAAAAVLAALLPGSALARVLVVTQRHVAYPHYSTIQAAVRAAARNDWILIDKGVYHGAVRVTTPGLHIRGIDRNKVILDGRHQRGNGIWVFKADDVWIENLTVKNFDRKSRDNSRTGNEVWWDGGYDSGKVGMSGWWGQYLTTYDTGLLGGYGLYVGNTVDGWFKHVYASGFNDSGVYIGACRDCRALVQDALIERNALGWSSTNAGGHMVVENSTFRENGLGVSPDSDSTGDLPAPQDGACNAGANRKNTPRFSSTRFAHCTIFRHNTIADNNNLSTPANHTLLAAPWGVGVMLPGDYGDEFDHNTITGNPNFGALLFEYPSPFPPTKRTVYFQNAGNRLTNNRIMDNGSRFGGADIGLEGGLFGQKQSVNNCFSGNTFATSTPANIQGTWGCQHRTTPNAGGSLFGELLRLLTESGNRHSVGQPAPPAQPTMPHPCRGVPRNPLCA